MYWETQTGSERNKGKGDYLTKRQIAELSGKVDFIDDYSVEWFAQKYVDVFWELRRFYTAETVITPRLMADYCFDAGVLLTRDERDILYKMDAAYRFAWGKRQAENNKARLEKHGR